MLPHLRAALQPLGGSRGRVAGVRAHLERPRLKEVDCIHDAEPCDGGGEYEEVAQHYVGHGLFLAHTISLQGRAMLCVLETLSSCMLRLCSEGTADAPCDLWAEPIIHGSTAAWQLGKQHKPLMARRTPHRRYRQCPPWAIVHLAVQPFTRLPHVNGHAAPPEETQQGERDNRTAPSTTHA